jgi:hypothetical protein
MQSADRGRLAADAGERRISAEGAGRVPRLGASWTATVAGAQDQKRTNDTLAVRAAVVVFWPAAFFVGGNGQTGAELAQFKGQMIAIEQASIAKKCNIQFQKG